MRLTGMTNPSLFTAADSIFFIREIQQVVPKHLGEALCSDWRGGYVSEPKDHAPVQLTRLKRFPLLLLSTQYRVTEAPRQLGIKKY